MAQATDIEVTVTATGPSEPSQVVASWTQDENPDPLAYVSDYYTAVPVWNTVGLGSDQSVIWYSNSHSGGFTNYGENFNVISTASYTSSEKTPSFVPGTYIGVNINQDFTYYDIAYTIAVLPDPMFKSALDRIDAAPLPGVPEPATWAMMMAGMGLIGHAVRRRRTASISYAR